MNNNRAPLRWGPPILPSVRDIPQRLRELRAYLDPNDPRYEREEQHINIRTAIALYEAGTIDGIRKVHVMNGEIVPLTKIFRGPYCSWSEGMSFQVSLRRYPGPYR